MASTLTGPFALVLREQRERFNTKFAQARRERPRLDPEAVLEGLRTSLAPAVEAVSAAAPEQTAPAADVLYDVLLDLVGQDLLGPAARYPVLNQGWAQLLPRLGRFLAAAPRAVAGSLTNALYNLSATPGARPEQWLSLMAAAGDACPDVETLLAAGPVAAWRAGLAHLRAGALKTAQTLPPAVARAALGLPDGSEPLETVLAGLAADPWWEPSSAGPLPAAARRIGVAARVGAFRGFGGLFLRPPIVAAAGEHFLVSDGEDSWLLVADVWGATFHRAAGLPTSRPPSPFSLSKDGTVKADGQAVRLPELAEITSHAANANTLAVTTALSHAVVLVALR